MTVEAGGQGKGRNIKGTGKMPKSYEGATAPESVWLLFWQGYMMESGVISHRGGQRFSASPPVRSTPPAVLPTLFLLLSHFLIVSIVANAHRNFAPWPAKPIAQDA